jgi:heptosyltransferase-2
MSRAVVVQTAWLGDMVLTTPLLVALAERHGPVDVVTTPDAAPLVATHPAVSRVTAWTKRGTWGGAGALIAMARRLRAEHYAVAYLPHRSVRTSLLARLAGIPRRVGFADAPWGARVLYTERPVCAGAHETERLLSLAAPGAPSHPTLGFTDSDHRAADAALRAAGIPEPFVVLAPGSARATKRWPHYGALLERIAQRQSVVIVGAPEDAGLMGAVAARIHGHACADVAGRLMIRETAALIARAALVVANDSAALHMAQAVGTPVVGIFGPTAPSLGFGPRGARDRVAAIALPCRPCSTHGGARCPLGHHRCLRDLSVDAVARDVDAALAGREVSACA